MGSLSGGILNQIVLTWLYFFYVDVNHFSSTAIGGAMVIYAIWNAVNDPLFGFISDRTRTRWGRRIPYIIFCTVPFAVAFMLIWMPPLSILKTDLSRIAYYLISICVYDTFYTIVLLNWTALFPEMYMHEKDRNRVSGLKMAFGVVGAIISTVAVEPFYKAFGWKTMAVVFGIIGCITMYMSLLGSRENPAHSEKQSLNLLESFKNTFINFSFLMFVFANTFVESFKNIVLATLPFYAKYVLNAENGVSIITGIIFVVSIGFVPFWIWVTNKKGARSTFIASLICFAVAVSAFFFAQSMTVAIVISVAAGFGLSGVLILTDVLIAQVIDEDQIKTRVRREGAYYGVNAFVIRFSIAVQSITMALIFNLFKYDSNLKVQSGSAVTGIRLLMSFIPVIFIAGAVVFMVFYPIHGEKLKAIKQNVIEMEK
jgi:Na+/melibiose symporter and related transporters